MKRQNVTVSLAADLVKEVRHLTVDRGLYLSAFLAAILAEHIESEKGYETARARQLRWMAEGFPMGTQGKAYWTRDQLHER